MNKHLVEKIISRHAELFFNIHKSLSFDFEYGDGWFDLIDSALTIIKSHRTPMEILEIKKHNNSLLIMLSISRIYDYDYPQGIIKMTHNLSKSICEACGHPAFSEFIGCSKCKSTLKIKSDKPEMTTGSPTDSSYMILTYLLETLKYSIRDIKENTDISKEKLKATVSSGVLSIAYNGNNNIINGMIDLLEVYYLKIDQNNGVEIAL